MTRIAGTAPLAEPFQLRRDIEAPAATSTLSRHGESLADVASRAGVGEAELRAANPGLTPFDALAPATRVSVPVPQDAHAPAAPEAHDIGHVGNTRTPTSPRDALEAIEGLSRPSTADLPPQLPDEDRQQVLEAREAAYDARVVSIAESALANAQPPEWSDFAELPPGIARMEYQLALQQYYADVGALRGMLADSRERQIESTPGFEALSPEQQQGVRDVLRDPAFQALPLHQQQAVVASMIAGEYYVTGVSSVEDHGFHSGDADATRFEITIDGGTTPVYVPTEQDPALDYHPLGEVASGLASLPEQSRERIERVDVNPERSPDDAYWEAEYNSPGFRSYMTAGAEGIVSIYPSDGPRPPQSSLESGLLHEVGHIVMGQDFNLWDTIAWSNAMASDGQSVSDYADNSIKEDFAETYQLYMSVIGTPQEADARAQFPERFEILDDMTGNG